jgi:hypothetical protein
MKTEKKSYATPSQKKKVPLSKEGQDLLKRVMKRLQLKRALVPPYKM